MVEDRKIENRRYARIRPSGSISKTGKLILDPKAPAVDCKVVDLSGGGACLELLAPATLPRRFMVVHGGTRKHCSLVWQKNLRFGVTF
jgi:hypothetical protein